MHKELKYKLSLVEAVFDASQDGVLVVDHDSREIRQYNKRFLEMWNISPEMASEQRDRIIISCVLDQLVEPDTFIKLTEELYANPQRESFDILNFKDGRIFERHSKALLIEGVVSGRVWYFRDISDRVRKDSMLIHNDKMATLGEMAGGIAHEINTPLNAIILNAEMLVEHSQSSFLSKSQLESSLDRIIKTGERIAKIVAGMKSFSRDTGTESAQAFSTRQLVQDAIDLCGERFKHHGVKINIDKNFANESVQGKFVQLSQVLVNLLSNSFDAIKDLDDRWVSIEGRIVSGFYEFSVTDSGHGIQKDIVEKMFQPFYTTKGIGAGTGLGLSISKGILEGQGGQLFYDSSSANTCFKLRLHHKVAKVVPLTEAA